MVIKQNIIYRNNNLNSLYMKVLNNMILKSISNNKWKLERIN